VLFRSLLLNGITIENVPLIIIQVTLTSFIPILLAALTALHYRERTAAQFIFSTALVVVILFVIALPANPLNLLTKLAVGTAGVEQWFVLASVILISIFLSISTQWYANRVGRDHHFS